MKKDRAPHGCRQQYLPKDMFIKYRRYHMKKVSILAVVFVFLIAAVVPGQETKRDFDPELVALAQNVTGCEEIVSIWPNDGKLGGKMANPADDDELMKTLIIFPRFNRPINSRNIGVYQAQALTQIGGKVKTELFSSNSGVIFNIFGESYEKHAEEIDGFFNQESRAVLSNVNQEGIILFTARNSKGAFVYSGAMLLSISRSDVAEASFNAGKELERIKSRFEKNPALRDRVDLDN